MSGHGALEILFHESSHAWDQILENAIAKASDVVFTIVGYPADVPMRGFDPERHVIERRLATATD